MIAHIGGVVLYVLLLIAGGVATVRQARRKPARIAAERALARSPIPAARAVRRAAPPVPRPVPPRPPSSLASFGEVDLTLPGAESAFAEKPKRRRARTAGNVAALGSRAWAANAVIAMEVLAPPVALRGGATPEGPRAL